MIDSIGLGEVVANLLYCAILATAVIGSMTFLIIRKKFLALIWLSIFLNFLSFLYFLGTIHYIFLNFSLFIWPIFNILLIIHYIRTRLKNKAK